MFSFVALDHLSSHSTPVHHTGVLHFETEAQWLQFLVTM